ncbi:response regulator transcription factor [Mycobacterium stomatepiae]|nr:response regulator transcription factor [Mycobacterium stomatepiae]
MPSVVIVDDEALIRSGFALILWAAQDIDVVATSDGVHAVEVITDHRPDVVLLDIRMPEKDGLAVLAELMAAGGSPVVAMLTTFDTDEYIASALRLGATGFLLKDTDPVQLPAMVRTLAAGGLVLSEKVTPKVIAGYLHDPVDRSAVRKVANLTDREIDVLHLLARGQANSEIAATLFSSVGTVKDHVSSILTKFSVSRRLEAALIAQRAGILDPGPRDPPCLIMHPSARHQRRADCAHRYGRHGIDAIRSHLFSSFAVGGSSQLFSCGFGCPRIALPQALSLLSVCVDHSGGCGHHRHAALRRWHCSP